MSNVDAQEESNLDEEQASKFRLKLEGFSFQSPPRQASAIQSTLRSNVRNSDGREGGQTEFNKHTSTSKKRTIVEEGDGSPSKAKKKRGYAPPEVYAHLNYLTDCMAEYLDVLFCGINPGVFSATVGHHFAHPGNRFYRMIHGAGFTDRLIRAEEDSTLPSRYNIGITDIVDRPSSSEDELSAEEMIRGVPTLLQKVSTYKPRFVCFIGKGMGQNVEKGFRRAISNDEMKAAGKLSSGPQSKASRSYRPTRKGAEKSKDSGIGLRPFKVTHTDPNSPVRETLFFVSHSSSGLATSMNLQQKTDVLKELRELVVKHKSNSLDTSSLEEIPVTQHSSGH